MKRKIAHVALIVEDYEEAIDYFTRILDFKLLEDIYQPEQDKRWVLVAPDSRGGASLLLARPSNETQTAYVGNQTGGRVTFFLQTSDFWTDFRLLQSRGVVFVREPKVADYGTVAVFADLYGNLWDLFEYTAPAKAAACLTDTVGG